MAQFANTFENPTFNSSTVVFGTNGMVSTPSLLSPSVFLYLYSAKEGRGDLLTFSLT